MGRLSVMGVVLPGSISYYIGYIEKISLNSTSNCKIRCSLPMLPGERGCESGISLSLRQLCPKLCRCHQQHHMLLHKIEYNCRKECSSLVMGTNQCPWNNRVLDFPLEFLLNKILKCWIITKSKTYCRFQQSRIVQVLFCRNRLDDLDL